MTWVQVSRLGNPLVNEVVIPASPQGRLQRPRADRRRRRAALRDEPEVPPLLEALFGIQTPPTPRNDLVTIFLTGIPGLNQPQNVTAVRDAASQHGDPAHQPAHRCWACSAATSPGFPNGRRVSDDVVDIALQAMAGATPLTPDFNAGLNARLGDGVERSDVRLLDRFPYVGVPYSGNDR